MNSIKTINKSQILYVSLCLLVFSLPLIEVLKQITLAVIIVYGFYYLYKNKIYIKYDILFFSFLGLIVAFVLSAITNSNSIEILDNSKYLFRLFFLFIVLYTFNYNIKLNKKIIYSALFGYMLSLMWGYYDFINADFNRLFLKLHSVGHINHSSIYMVFMLIILISYILFNKTLFDFKEKIMLYIIFFITFATIFLIGSRAAMYTSIGILSILAIYYLFITKNYQNLLVFIFLPFIAYFIMDVYSLSEVKFMKGFQDSPRVSLIISGIQDWQESGNYLFGLGAGNFNISGNAIASHAHNTYINLLVENGLLGLGFYLVFMLSLGLKLFNQLKEHKKSCILIISMLLWIANMVLSFANTTFHHENALLIIIFWILAINTKYTSEQNK